MSSVDAGLETGGGGIDPNSDAGFMAALANAADVEVSDETLANVQESDTDVSRGLEFTEESARGSNRDSQGRFAPAAPAPEEVVEGAAPTGDEEQTDPALDDLLSRYGGDPNAALAAILRERDEAQSLIGRQGNELGEARRAQQELAERLARLEGRMEATSATPTPIVTTETIEAVQDMVENRGGREAMRWVADNQPHLIDVALEAWAEVAPHEAAGWNARYQTYLAQQELAADRQPQAEQQPDPFVESLRRERQLGETIANVRGSLPANDWAVVKDHLIPTLQAAETPDIVKNAVMADDPATQQQGVFALVQLAKGRAIAAATAEASRPQQEARRAVKQAAQVATGSQRPVAQRQPQGDISPEEREANVRKFHEQLLSTEITSVRDGLTFSK